MLYRHLITKRERGKGHSMIRREFISEARGTWRDINVYFALVVTKNTDMEDSDIREGYVDILGD